MNAATTRRVAVAAALVAAGNILSGLLGFVREPVIAALFGASGATDAFEVATRMPQLVHELVIGGAVSGVLIPLFSELADDDRRLARTFSSLITSVGVALIGVTVVLVALAEPLVAAAAPGLSAETRDLAVVMTRITLPAVLFLGLSAVTAARLYARDRFAAPSFAPATLNGTLIVLALALTPVVGPVGVAIGYLAGAGAHLLVQLPALVRDGVRVTAPAWRGNPDTARALRLYLPIAAGFVVAQALVIVDTNLASRTGEGSLAIMRFATRLQQFPLGLIGSAIALAFLPVLARSAPEKARDLANAVEFKSALVAAARSAFVLMVPVTVILTALSVPVIRVVYERGAFDAAATDLTGLALLIYAVQLPITVLDQIFIAAFYATRNTLTPVLVGVGGGLAYLVVALALIEPFGVFGLVAANSVQNSLHGVVLGWLLWRRVGGFGDPGLWSFGVRVVAAGVCAAVAGLLLREWSVEALAPDGAAGWRVLLVSGTGILAVFAAMLLLLRVPELPMLARLVRDRIARRGITVSGSNE
ncbi:MAG: murein biosynthesis integral membrane protein MurJ [Chloroflexota bacterium]|nr:murein biosynthesis integral membrane protein MurJ [Chloroflexota bacterium]MDE2896992.1 murein biosynthesis integral membrane protein MurJ [Chloroflexota bacterium]